MKKEKENIDICSINVICQKHYLNPQKLMNAELKNKIIIPEDAEFDMQFMCFL